MHCMKLAGLGFSVFLAIFGAPAYSQEQAQPAQMQRMPDSWTSRAMGQYGGRMISVSGPLASSVDLEFSSGGAISGEYGFTQSGERIEGTLDSCAVMRPFAIACRWRDRNGEGALEMVFARDLSSFVGRWNTTETPEKWRSWFGRKFPSI
jgi:hypothetical protein